MIREEFAPQAMRILNGRRWHINFKIQVNLLKIYDYAANKIQNKKFRYKEIGYKIIIRY